MVIKDISKYNKKDYDTILDYVYYQMPRLRRSRLMLKAELIFHSWCYKHNIAVEHTKDVDITEKLSLKERITYSTIGMLLWVIVK